MSEVREGTLEDVPAVARMIALAEQDRVLTPEALLHFVRTVPERARRRLFAVDGPDGELIGWGAAGLRWEADVAGQAFTSILVHPLHRGRGSGAGLWEHVDAHLTTIEATRVTAGGPDEPATHAFAAARGFREVSRERISRLDLVTLPAPPPLPDGVELRPLADYADDPRPVWRLDAETSRDIPGEHAMEDLPYDEWLERYWALPLTDYDLSLVLLSGGEPASFTIIAADHDTGRLETGMTGTLREFRGRGYGELVKRHALTRARDRGIAAAFTQNDETNVPMLRINEKLGYRPSSSRVTFVRG